jgi:nucleotide-binding universal stress UspA family protein
MTTILCPTRGGKSSIPNQLWAIDLARRENARLIFLYVSDVRFLNTLSSPVLVDVAHELDEMGEFLLQMAQDRAIEQGIEAKILVRQGVFRSALRTLIEEYEVDIVVIGAAVRGTGFTTGDYLDQLAKIVRSRSADGPGRCR